MYVCVCKSVTQAEIVERVRGGACCFDALQFETGVAGGCGRCEDTARALVAETLRVTVAAGPAAGPSTAAGPLTAVESSAADAPRPMAISRRLPISARGR